MRKNSYFYTRLLCSVRGLLFFAFFMVIGAVQPLYASETPGGQFKLKFERYADGQNVEAFRFYSMDLNADLIDEIVSVPRHCPAGDFCTHTVWGEGKDTIYPLLTIDTRTLKVASDSHYQVLDLQSYDVGNNEYAYTRYIWEPVEGRFVRAKESGGS